MHTGLRITPWHGPNLWANPATPGPSPVRSARQLQACRVNQWVTNYVPTGVWNYGWGELRLPVPVSASELATSAGLLTVDLHYCESET